MPRPTPPLIGALVLGCATSSPAPTGGDDSAATGDSGVIRAALQLALPLTEPERFYLRVGVDHDPTVQPQGIDELTCADYLGRSFPHCYDGHDGTDLLLEGSFGAMDAGSSPVVAAAAGTVSSVEDGHYDRCHGSMGGGNDCDGHEMIANHVTIAHDTGHTTRYWHLAQGSVQVDVGDAVQAGEMLGLVGSSGNSFAPHLHFEVQDGDGTVVDPFAGPWSQEETYWCVQGPDDGLPGGCEEARR